MDNDIVDTGGINPHDFPKGSRPHVHPKPPYHLIPDFNENHNLLLAEFFHKLSRNDTLVNQLKLEGQIGNINPVKDRHSKYHHRQSPAATDIVDNLVLYANSVRITPKNLKRKAKDKHPANHFSAAFRFPQNNRGAYFKSNYLPVVTANIRYNTDRNTILVINDQTSQGFEYSVMDLTNKAFTGNDVFFLEILAIGVAGGFHQPIHHPLKHHNV